MRYPTVGDWRITESGIEVDVLATQDPRYELLLAVHEVIEAWLCARAGITTDAVDTFDMEFVKIHPDPNLEPGDDPKAPYHVQHNIATEIEKILAWRYNVKWSRYEKYLNDEYEKIMVSHGLSITKESKLKTVWKWLVSHL